MTQYSLAHLSDGALLNGVRSLLAQDRDVTARLLAHLAEVDARKLYLPAAYPSMFAWCVGHLGLSEDAAAKRIHAARAASRFPVIFEMVADGRLHLSAVSMLAARLTPENVSELLTASTHRSKTQIERLLAERFPQPDLATLVRAVGSAPSVSVTHAPSVHELSPEHAPGHMNICTSSASAPEPSLAAPTPSGTPVMHIPAPVAPARVAPLSPGRFGLQVTVSKATHDKLERAKELLGHAVSHNDLAQVLDRALDALIAQLERKRFAKCARPGVSRRSADGRERRHIPAAIKRTVWDRDAGQCTFVSSDGHRCEARSGLEFDHTKPFAQGGESTPSNLRLRCRAHNQSDAERVFGKGFMEHKRGQARERALECGASGV